MYDDPPPPQVRRNMLLTSETTPSFPSRVSQRRRCVPGGGDHPWKPLGWLKNGLSMLSKTGKPVKKAGKQGMEEAAGVAEERPLFQNCEPVKKGGKPGWGSEGGCVKQAASR